MPLQFDFRVPTATIIPFDELSMGPQLGIAPTTALYPAANRALYIPFTLYKPATVYKMFVVNGAAVSGNFDLGIYDVAGVRLFSTGSTAQAGVNDYQEVTLGTPLQLGPGYFYMAIAADDDVTAQYMRRGLGAYENEVAGMYQESTAFPLPANATYTDISTSYIPLIGMRFLDV